MDILTTIAILFIVFEIVTAYVAWKSSKKDSQFFIEEEPTKSDLDSIKHDAVVFINVEEHHGHFYAWLIDADQRENFVTQAASYELLKEEVTKKLRHESLTLKLIFTKS